MSPSRASWPAPESFDVKVIQGVINVWQIGRQCLPCVDFLFGSPSGGLFARLRVHWAEGCEGLMGRSIG